MTDAPRRFDLPTPEMRALADACNKALVGIAKVHLYVRNDPDRPRYCVLISDQRRRWTSESDQPLDESDKDEIVKMAKELTSKPRSVAERYQPFEL